MPSVLRDSKEILLIDYLQSSHIINGEYNV